MRALVTGGGRGVGANIARGLAAAGAEVVVTARTRGEIDAVAQEIRGRPIEMDVADRESIERGFAATGPIDLLVANAGTGSRGGATGHIAQAAWEIDPCEWWHTFEVNVLGIHLCCRAVIPSMLGRRTGRIIIVGSGAAYLPNGTETAYTASKAAACRYGETLANALRDHIPVFVISPGLVRTTLTDTLPDDAPGRHPSAHHDSSPRSQPEHSTPSPAATFTPNTTHPKSCTSASTPSSPTTSMQYGYGDD